MRTPEADRVHDRRLARIAFTAGVVGLITTPVVFGPSGWYLGYAFFAAGWIGWLHRSPDSRFSRRR
jgi:hypothetical protein